MYFRVSQYLRSIHVNYFMIRNIYIFWTSYSKLHAPHPPKNPYCFVKLHLEIYNINEYKSKVFLYIY